MIIMTKWERNDTVSPQRKKNNSCHSLVRVNRIEERFFPRKFIGITYDYQSHCYEEDCSNECTLRDTRVLLVGSLTHYGNISVNLQQKNSRQLNNIIYVSPETYVTTLL